MATRSSIRPGIIRAPSLHLRQPGFLENSHQATWNNCGRKHGEYHYQFRLVMPGDVRSCRHIHRHFIDDPGDAEDFWLQLSGLQPWLPAPSWFPALNDYPGTYYAVDVVTFITTTGAGTYSRPLNFDDTANHFECISSSNGTPILSSVQSSNGGGYSYIANQAIVAGVNNDYSVGAGGATGSIGGDTFFGSNSISTSFVAATAANATRGGNDLGTGTPIGSLTFIGAHNSDIGGNGAAGPLGNGAAGGFTATNPGPGAGGGGNGNGSAGASGSGTTGGAGGNNSGGTGHGNGGASASNGTAGTAGGGGGGGGQTSGNGAAGGTGQEWDATHGSGGGGGSCGVNASFAATGTAGAGGLYGGGGGFGSAQIVGKQGIIVVTYTPSSLLLYNRWPQLGPILAQ